MPRLLDRTKKMAGVALGLLAGAGVACSVVYLFGIDPWLGYETVRARLFPGPALGDGIFEPHPTRGAQTIPLGTNRHTTAEFDVVYSIDVTGARRVPGNDYALPIVELLGDSFTFGHGVADGETFGAVLRRDYWPDLAIRNRAILGWSMVPNALILDHDLAGEFQPKLVVYGWLSVHNERAFNYLRDSGAPFPDWLRELKMELVDPVPPASVADPAVQRVLGHALLRKMSKSAKAQGVPFWVVILAMPGWGPHEDEVAHLVPFLEGEGIPYVDLQHHPGFASRGRLQYPVDHHPTPPYHRRAARAIAAAIDVDELALPSEDAGAGEPGIARAASSSED